VVVELPFGDTSVKWTSGVKQEIPNLVRTMVNARIIQQYEAFLEETHMPDMKMSHSTYLRILHACTTTT